MELSDPGVQRAITIGIAVCAVGAFVAALRMLAVTLDERNW